jgi:hypothetical protein
MFGSAGTLVLVVVTRVLGARAWRDGIGLTLTLRLVIPAISLVVGLIAVRTGASTIVRSPHVLVVLLALAITVAGGVARARTVVFSETPETWRYPGGVLVRARPVTLGADVAAIVGAAALIIPTITPAAGLATAAGALIIVGALGDVVASGLLVLRGRPASATAHGSRTDHRA